MARRKSNPRLQPQDLHFHSTPLMVMVLFYWFPKARGFLQPTQVTPIYDRGSHDRQDPPFCPGTEDEIIETRRDIHKHPELSFQEFRTAQLVSDRLQSRESAFRKKLVKPSCRNSSGGKPGPTVALRADMDALPMQETLTSLTLRSTMESMHAGARWTYRDAFRGL